MTDAADRKKAASDVRWARAVEAAENKTHARLARMAEAGERIVAAWRGCENDQLESTIAAYEKASRCDS